MNVHLTVFGTFAPFCDMLHSHYTIAIHSINRWWTIMGRNMFFSIKPNTLQTSSWEQVSNRIATGHQHIAWIASDRLICHLLHFNHNKKWYFPPNNTGKCWIKAKPWGKELYIFNLISIYHMTCYTPVSALPEMLWTTSGLLLCTRKSQTSTAPSTRVT
jgi:hypothetical protein